MNRIAHLPRTALAGLPLLLALLFISLCTPSLMAQDTASSEAKAMTSQEAVYRLANPKVEADNIGPAYSTNGDNIGQGAKMRAQEVSQQPREITEKDVNSLITWVKVLGLLLLGFVLVLLERMARFVNFDPFKKLDKDNVQPKIFIFAGLLLTGFLIYHIYQHTQFLLPASASKHGENIDTLILITTVVCVIAFIAVQFLLFWFPHKYRSAPGKKALFYPDNNKIEMLWTIIPAIGLAVMIIPGLKYWSNITGDKESGVPEMNMEVVGQQFNWTFRYPGEDKALGPVEFDQIGADNTLGLDTTSAKTQDDFTTKEMHVPVNTRINVQIRSLDVLHGFYLPHFRANMYATPGMPTNFSFTPTMTTQEARKKYNDKDFDFELACTQLCGGSHYQMRSIVVVHSQEGYREWYQKQLKENSGGDSDGDGKSQDQKEKGKESMPKQAQKQASDEAAQQPNA